METTTPPATSTLGPWRTGLLAGMASYLDAGAIVGTGAVLVLYQSTLNLNSAPASA